MQLSNIDIENLAPDAQSLDTSKKMAIKEKWKVIAKSDRGIWGKIKGSAIEPYQTQVELIPLGYKCSCPSRKFPCIHVLALLLLHSNDNQSFTDTEEPSDIKDWLDKRIQKRGKVEMPAKELTPEIIEKREKEQDKRKKERAIFVESGITELDRWLKDLIKNGILQLPYKENNYFEKMAARLVDAKAPGLANFIRKLQKLDFSKTDQWHQEAFQIIGKTYFLMDAYLNIDNQPIPLQSTIKNLIGWSQSTKDLLASEQKGVKDDWLVIGQIIEENDDLITQKNWLWGIQSNQPALIINFGTRFAPLDSQLIAGMFFHAELLYFDTAFPQRAIIKEHIAPPNQQLHLKADDNWEVIDKKLLSAILENPWIEDFPILINSTNIQTSQKNTYIIDNQNNAKIIDPNYPLEKLLNLMMIHEKNSVIAGLLSNQNFIPFGIFSEHNYQVL